jgi:hypothetical protein
MSYVKSEVYLIDRAFLNFVPRGLHARNNFKTHYQRLSPQFLTHIQAFPLRDMHDPAHCRIAVCDTGQHT